MVFYQKYRPQKIADLDLVKVRDELKRVLSANDIPHAYLFVGPRGLGKTSAARILAKVVNCTAKGDDACSRCSACKSVVNQSSADVIEIDAASHRGIDDIRALRERVRLSPVSMKYKVYIIDEVHMLSKEAFNGLLKTLEEPPERVIFVLCTTEEEKVLDTIVSRCVRIGFSKASKEEMRASLEKVIKKEKIKISAKALDLLIDSLDGSFRGGHKILEQLSRVKGKVDVARVESLLELVGESYVHKVIDWIDHSETKKVLKAIVSWESDGVSELVVIKALLSVLRVELVSLLQKRDLAKTYQAKRALVENLVAVSEKLRFAVVPFLELELCLLEACLLSGSDGVVLDKKTQRGERSEQLQGVGQEPSFSKREASDRVLETKPRISEPLSDNNKGRGSVKDAKIDDVLAGWGTLLQGLSPKNHSVAGLMRASRPKRLEGNCLIIEVFYKFHKEQLEQEERRLMIESVAGELWGVTKIKFELGEGKALQELKQKKDFVQDNEAVADSDGSFESDLGAVAEEIFG